MTRPFGLLILMMGGFTTLGGLYMVTSPAQVARDGDMSTVGAVVVGLALVLVFGPALLIAGGYLVRGKGRAIQEFDSWFAMQQKRNTDLMAMGWRGWLGFGTPQRTHAPSASYDAATTAQINAVANPDTARALQNLQNLRYTRAISDDEFQAAKDKLLRSPAASAYADSINHVNKLVELHQAGILNDVEFATAKLKALGLA